MRTDLPARRGDYGVDGDFRRVSAAGQAIILGAVCAGLVALTVVGIGTGRPVVAAVAGVLAAGLASMYASYAFTTRVGKFRVWAGILAGLELRGDETLLDLGCGRGAVLLAAAALLPAGHAIGADLWRADQSGNSPATTRRNAEREGVADRVAVVSADMVRLPFADGSADVVVSNLAIHNIAAAEDRRVAVDEAVRVLRPGGRLVLADLRFTGDHVARLQSLGLADVAHHDLGWRMWWGGPWVRTRLVTASKGSAVQGDAPLDPA